MTLVTKGTDGTDGTERTEQTAHTAHTERTRLRAHPLRAEFLRGFAPCTGGAVLLTLAVALAVPAESWQGGWVETSDHVHAAAHMLGVPLALAAGCWQGGRERRRRTTELMATSVRGPLSRFLASGLPLALWVAVGHLVAVALAWLATWYCATGDSPYLIVPLADTAVVGCAALAGQVVGRVVPWRSAAPLLAVAAFAALGVLSYDRKGALAYLSPVSDTRAHEVPVWWQPLAVAAWMGGLALAAVLAHAARHRLTALLPLAAATAAGALLLQTGDGPARTNPVARHQVCDTSTTPQICVNARHEKLLPQITQALSGLTGQLEGVQNLPVRFEDRPGRSRPDEVRLPMITPFGSSVVRGRLTDPERYAWEAGMMLIGRAWCDRTDPRVARTDHAVEYYLAPSPAQAYFDELDRTAVRPWWRRRLLHLLALTALATALLPLAVLTSAQTFGPPAMIRNVLGCTGLTAAAAVVLGARLSWLPVFGYVSAMYLGVAGRQGGSLPVWAWLLEPTAGGGAWTAAAVLFLLGSALYAIRGACPTP